MEILFVAVFIIGSAVGSIFVFAFLEGIRTLFGMKAALATCLLLVGLAGYCFHLIASASPAGTDRSAEPAGTFPGQSADRP